MVRRPRGMRDDQAAHGVDQVALEVCTEDRTSVPVGAGDQVAIDHQRSGPLHEIDQDVLFAVQRRAREAGQHLRHRDRVGGGQVLHRLWRHDVRQGEQAERPGLLGVGQPSDEEETGSATFQPCRQGTEVARPLLAAFVGDDDLAESPVQFRAQAGDEGGVAPARFELAPRRDRCAAGDDMPVGALQRIERNLEPEAEEPADLTEEVVRGGRQQVDEGGVVADRCEQVGLEACTVRPVAELDARDQVLVRSQDLVDGPGPHARVYRRVGARGRVDGGLVPDLGLHAGSGPEPEDREDGHIASLPGCKGDVQRAGRCGLCGNGAEMVL